LVAFPIPTSLELLLQLLLLLLLTVVVIALLQWHTLFTRSDGLT